MLEINKASARMWSRIGSRAVYGQAILKLADTYPKMLALSADLGSSSGLAPFIRKYPDRFINIGIAEQNMIGIAAGLSKEGFIPFASSFAPFVSMRASEQIRMELGYMELNVKVVALGSGLSLGFLGNSHYGLEDVAIMRTIPNLCIVSPADCVEIVKVVDAAARYEGPMYIRLTGGVNNLPIYEEDYNFQIGKAIKMREGKDVVIFASGTMVAQSIIAHDLLEQDSISSAVINMHTIKPLDEDVIDQACKSSKLLVTVEEHTVIGGLGAAVSESLSMIKEKPRQLILGLPDKFGKTAEHEHLLDKYGLLGDQIAMRIINSLQ